MDDWRPDALPGEPDWLLHVVVPDDARELDADLAAYHRELRAQQRAQQGSGIFAGRRWHQYGVPLTLLALILVMVTGIGGMLNFVRPGQALHLTRAEPLAPVGTAPETSGGLLPDVPLLISGTTAFALTYRPAVFALLPRPCRCAQLVNDLAGQAQAFDMNLVIVGPSRSDTEVTTLANEATRGSVIAGDDSSGELRARFHAAGVTVLIVAADGRVTGVDRNVGQRSRLEGQLWGASRLGAH